MKHEFSSLFFQKFPSYCKSGGRDKTFVIFFFFVTSASMASIFSSFLSVDKIGGDATTMRGNYLNYGKRNCWKKNSTACWNDVFRVLILLHLSFEILIIGNGNFYSFRLVN